MSIFEMAVIGLCIDNAVHLWRVAQLKARIEALESSTNNK